MIKKQSIIYNSHEKYESEGFWLSKVREIKNRRLKKNKWIDLLKKTLFII